MDIKSVELLFYATNFMTEHQTEPSFCLVLVNFPEFQYTHRDKKNKNKQKIESKKCAVDMIMI